MHKMKKYRFFLIALLLAMMGFIYYLRNISNTYYFQSVQAPDSCVQKTESRCYTGKILVETVAGDEVTFFYTTADPPKVTKNAALSTFKKDQKIQIKTSGDDTGDDKVVRSVRVVGRL